LVEGVRDDHSWFGRHVSSFTIHVCILRVIQGKKRVAKIGANLSRRFTPEVNYCLRGHISLCYLARGEDFTSLLVTC